MKRAAFVALLFIVPLIASAAPPTQAVIVMTKQSSQFSIRSLSTSFDPSVSVDERDVRKFTAIRGFAANLTSDEIASLKASGQVISIEPDREVHALTDTITLGQQTIPYGVTMIDAPPVWAVTRGKSLANGPAIHIAIIDTGIDYKNPELSAAFKEGFNFVSRTTDPLDDAGHGSHVAGTIAALNDTNGVVGIASDVDVYSLKVLNGCGNGRTSDIIQAVDWIVQKKKVVGGNWIVNLSLGANTPSDSEQAEFQAASDAGILVFAASGNAFDGATPGLSYPAGYPTVTSVGAIDSTETVADFSQRGPDLKLVAPGVDVLSTFLTGLVSTDDGRKIAANFPDGTTPTGDDVCLLRGPVTAKFVSCGVGNTSDIPSSVSGKIALIERGGQDSLGTSLTFLQKTRNAMAKGAIGVVIYDNANNPNPFVSPAFQNLKTTDGATLPPTVLIQRNDGLALLATPNATVTLRFDQQGSTELFALLAGTSMACPHAVGAAALVWASSPNSTAGNVVTALEQTAKDLGNPGRDDTYGFGLVDAFAAAKQLNPAVFDPGPTIGPVKGRIAGRRGH